MPAPTTLPLTIAKNELLVPGFHRIEFLPQPLLHYEPGQFLTFVHPIAGQELRRSYSLLTVPGLDASPAIGVRRIDNGLFSRFLTDDARPGTVLHCTGAAGMFRLPPHTAGQQLFFLAAGSGITPIYSLLRAALYERPGSEAVLIYSSQDPSTAIFRQQLANLAIGFGHRLRIHFLYSSDPQLRKARLNRDLLLQLLRNERADAQRSWFYCCGPESYMRFCTYVLRESGIPRERIRLEDFIPAPPLVPALVPPDTTARTVVVYWQGRGWSFRVAWPDTILKAAARAGLELPYSCGAGRCASCVARCLEGQTWLAQNEVLTDADLRSGLTLTCTAFPVGGALTLLLDDTDTTAPIRPI